MVRQSSKRVGEGPLLFQLQLNTLVPYVSQQIKKLKDWVRRTWGLYLKILSQHVIFHSVLWVSHSWYLSNFFMYTLYILLSVPDTTCHTHRKHQSKLHFSFSQYLRPWIATSRHQIYNLLVIRHSPKFFCTQF